VKRKNNCFERINDRNKNIRHISRVILHPHAVSSELKKEYKKVEWVIPIIVIGIFLLLSNLPSVTGSFCNSSLTSDTPGSTAFYIPFPPSLFVRIFSTLTGKLSSLYPVLKTESLPPVIALKYE
jgi:hypothetical protein